MMKLAKMIFICLFVSLVSTCSKPTEESILPPSTPGVTDKEIILGTSLALSGHASFLGTQTLYGALCYLNAVNDRGGIHGRKIRLISYDDGYDPPQCLANTQKLIAEDMVFALFCYVGTPTSAKIIPIIKEAKIPLVGIFSGAQILRKPFIRYIINIRTSYYQEIAAVIMQLVQSMGIKKIAVFYQYDDYGFDGLAGTQIALERYGLEPVAAGSYQRGSLEIEAAFEKIMASKAEAVVMVGTANPCAKFIRLAALKDFYPIFHCVSFMGADQLANKLGKAGEGVIITQVVPSPAETLLLPAAAEYTRFLAHYYPDEKPNYVGFEGYINARVVVEGLRRAGRDLSREGLIDAFEGIDNLSLGIANPLSFSSTDHQGLKNIYFTQIHEGRIILLTNIERMIKH